ncbi:hypothetical protein K8I85_02820 [bacterium]|nr:hypothetical protein [bacterium]
MQRTILTVTLLAFLVASPALADRRVEPLASHATIHNGNAHRLLFKADGFRALNSVAIRHAVIEFDLGGATADRSLYLSLSPVTTAWNAASADWTNGWQRPGGDFDGDLAAEIAVDLSRADGKAAFDVTPILKEWMEQGAEYDGFILTVQPREGGEGIRGEDVSRLQGLTGASLVVDYRKVPPPPGSRRHRG